MQDISQNIWPGLHKLPIKKKKVQRMFQIKREYKQQPNAKRELDHGFKKCAVVGEILTWAKYKRFLGII